MANVDLDAQADEASRGDREALDDVLAELTPIVDRYCRARLGGRERPILSPEDLTQDVLLSVITSLPRWRQDSGSFIGFVYGIAAHKVANAFRSLGRDRSEATSDAPELFDVAEATWGPEEQAMDAWSRRRVNRLLGHLPERQREVLVLRTVVGLTAEEVAEATDSTPGAVRIAQHRALRRLRELLADDVREKRAAREERAARGSARPPVGGRPRPWSVTGPRGTG